MVNRPLLEVNNFQPKLPAKACGKETRQANVKAMINLKFRVFHICNVLYVPMSDMKRIIFTALLLFVAGNVACVSICHARQNEVECKPGDRACKVNDAIDEFEDAVHDMSEDGENGGIWRLDDKEEDKKTERTSQRIFKYPLKAPTFILRVATWPFAKLADLLIKKGVVHSIVDVVSNDERTFWVYPKFELGFGSGFGGGVGMKHFDLLDDGYKFSANYLINIGLNQSGKISLGKRKAFYWGKTPFAFKTTTEVVHRNDAKFYGLGSKSLRSDKADFEISTARIGGSIGVEPVENFIIGFHLYSEMDTTDPGSGEPSVESMFPASTLVGFQKVLYYANIGFSLVHDNRDSTANPMRGGVRRLAFKRYQGLDYTGFDYNEYALEIIQFIPTWMDRHTLGLRMAWNFLHSTGGNNIPFYRLAKLDVYSPMRGFDYGRFRDTSCVVFNMEYRFPVWDYLDGTLFFDTGRVFHGPKDFSFKNFKFAGGGGLSLRTKNYFLLRFQAGYGGEGPKFMIKTSQAF
jgi:hypothetical protein